MQRSTHNSQHPRKWAVALRREMQTAIGQQLRDKYELPQEPTPELSARLIREDKNTIPTLTSSVRVDRRGHSGERRHADSTEATGDQRRPASISPRPKGCSCC